VLIETVHSTANVARFPISRGTGRLIRLVDCKSSIFVKPLKKPAEVLAGAGVKIPHRNAAAAF